MLSQSRTLQISTATLAALGLGATAATAQSYDETQSLINQIETYESQYNLEPVSSQASDLGQTSLGQTSLGQTIGAAQFSDVSPADWAYQALDDLVRRYDCLKGYPNGTFRGNRALSRYEFAAGLNACLQQIERLLAESTADFVTRDDLAALDRLMAEFEAELAELSTRVDTLESRAAFLEDHSFSTTTKLTGEVIFAATSLFPSSNAFDGTQGAAFPAAVDNNDDEITFGYQARLTLNTSFSGNDRLVTRLSLGNLTAPNANTNIVDTSTFGIAGLTGTVTAQTAEATQTFNVDTGTVAYYFPIKGADGYIAASGGTWSDFVPTLNPYFEDYDGGNGALSTFATRSPIYRIGGGAGVGLSYDFGEKFNLAVGYLAGQANVANRGLFSGDYAILGQLSADLTDDISLGLTYVHGYHPNGTALFDRGDVSSLGVVGTSTGNSAVSSMVNNSYGLELAWAISDAVSFSGFFAYTDIIGTSLATGDGEVWTYGLGFAFPDLGGEGNLLGLFAGAQPYAGSIDNIAGGYRMDETPYHIELFYKYQLSDRISITPGFIWLTAPNDINEDALIGTIRTTFTF
ncbi:MAG: iron uptake porin [Spirulinaceae cyanobacterium]